VDSHPAAGQLVGRETELAQLELTLDRLDRGEAACVTVEGVEVARMVERERRERDASAEPA
jgi:antitoxin (DNA-binding transcriptional repressor) of toxin-antitoxin stability system